MQKVYQQSQGCVDGRLPCCGVGWTGYTLLNMCRGVIDVLLAHGMPHVCKCYSCKTKINFDNTLHRDNHDGLLSNLFPYPSLTSH